MTDQQLIIRFVLRMHRIRYVMYLKIIIIVGLLYVGVQTMLATNNAMKMSGGKLINSETQNHTSEQVLALVPPQIHENLTVYLKNSTGNSTERHGLKNITEMRKAIQKINEEQTIYNEDIFGSVQNDTIIIAIQVNTRITYLRHLIVSLAQARDIEETLLIFSHDYYDEEINNLVKSIDFTKVMQIFYPYSIQTHPTEFPGTDPNDCPRDIELREAIKLKCNNALHPDLNGYYREAKYTQTKHHWWWKANRIFNQLQITAGHTGLVVFLEDDHYVAQDFIRIIHLLQATRDNICPHCEILCAGAKLRTFEEHFAILDVEIADWNTIVHNMGFAFKKTVWEYIVEFQELFCDYDDYNWDYSLLHLSQNKLVGNNFKVVVCKEPRVFHVGGCGVDYKKSNCDVSSIINTVHKFLRKKKSYMNTDVADVTVVLGASMERQWSFGQWADLRDHELCLNMTTVGRKM